MKTATKPQQFSTAVTRCRACGSGAIVEIVNLGDQYVANFVREKDVSLPRAPLVLHRCADCGLMQLSHSVDKEILWKGDYWYRSGINKTMNDALADVVHQALRTHDEGVWLDIGANDGTLLSKVPNTFRKIGCEPSRALHSLLEEHADKVVPDFFSVDAVDEPASVITSCAMFYDLDDPKSFCDDIHDTLTSDGIWINQLSDAAALVRGNAWDGICHEHRCYWDLPQLERLYSEAGLKILDISDNEVNGGSIRIVAKKGEGGPPKYSGLSQQEIEDFAARIPRWKQLMGWVFDAMRMANRSIYGYAASTKSCTLLQYLDRNHEIKAIADRNPIKHGTVMAGTWIPVIDEETMRKAKPDVLIGLAWAFEKEFSEREKDLMRQGTTMLWPLPCVKFTL